MTTPSMPPLCRALAKEGIPLEVIPDVDPLQPGTTLFEKMCPVVMETVAKAQPSIDQQYRDAGIAVPPQHWTPALVRQAARVAQQAKVPIVFSVMQMEKSGGPSAWMRGGVVYLSLEQPFAATALKKTIAHEAGHIRDITLLQASFPEHRELLMQSPLAGMERQTLINIYLSAMLQNTPAAAKNQVLADLRYMARTIDGSAMFTFAAEALRYGEETQCGGIKREIKQSGVPPIFQTGAGAGDEAVHRAVIAARCQLGGAWDALVKHKDVNPAALKQIDPIGLRLFTTLITGAQQLFPKPICY